MPNSIQFYYPQKSTEAVFPLVQITFNTPSSTCWVIFFFCLCMYPFWVHLLSCGLLPSPRTPCLQTWRKQKSLTWFTDVCTQTCSCFMCFALSFSRQTWAPFLSLLCRIIQNRILIFILGAVIVVTIILAVYFNLRGHWSPSPLIRTHTLAPPPWQIQTHTLVINSDKALFSCN